MQAETTFPKENKLDVGPTSDFGVRYFYEPKASLPQSVQEVFHTTIRFGFSNT